MLNDLLCFLRKHFQCRFGVHWRMKYEGGLVNDICRAGKCDDCGYEREEVKWPRT